MEEVLAAVWVGGDTPVQAVGGGHPHPTAFLEAPCIQADRARMMQTGLCSCRSLCLDFFSSLPSNLHAFAAARWDPLASF